jgi:hypothetical protein
MSFADGKPDRVSKGTVFMSQIIAKISFRSGPRPPLYHFTGRGIDARRSFTSPQTPQFRTAMIALHVAQAKNEHQSCKSTVCHSFLNFNRGKYEQILTKWE